MDDFEQNPRAVIGGNQTAFDDAVATFDFVGFLLARHETLARAALDDKVDRACLKVLCVLIATMNRDTRTSWAGREYIAQQLGMAVKTVSNYIYQLKCLGYLVSERRATPLADGRVLMHYTLSKLKPAEIEAAIERAISSIRGDRNSVVQFPSPREVTPESSRQDRNSVPVGTGTLKNSSSQDGKSKMDVPAPTGTQIETVPVAAGTEAESSRQDGCSNINTNTTSNSRARGERGAGREDEAKATRLKPDWYLPEPWGRWALENLHITRDQIYTEAESFADYWHGKSGKDARKADWEATWRNWLRNSRAKYRRRRVDKSIAPDLLDAPASAQRTIEENEAFAAAQGWVVPNQDVTRE